MNKRTITTRLTTWLLILCMAICVIPVQKVQAATGRKYTLSGTVIGVENSKGQIVFKPTSDPNWNARALNELLNSDLTRTVKIPKGSYVKVGYTLRIGSNTKLIATGATISQVTDGKGVLSNIVDATSYGSIKNVVIQGGTFKNEVNKTGCTIIRLAHGSGVTIDGVNVELNYKGHGIELIAMKDVVIKNSTLKAKGTVSATSVEEAIQIDVATKSTAPGVYSETGQSKYVRGQVCKNITISNNYVEASRGVCANYASKEATYKNKYHDNITITGNTLVGVTSEGCTLFNTLNATVKNNTIISNSSRVKDSYSVGLNIALMGKAPSSIRNAEVYVYGNALKGGRQGLSIVSISGSKYGQVTAKKNTIGAFSGADNAIQLGANAYRAKTVTGNTTFDWKPSLDTSILSVNKNKTATLTMRDGSTVIWKSSDPTIAEVTKLNDTQAKITGKKAGKVTISAKTKGVYRKCTVYVEDPKLPKSVTVHMDGSRTVKLTGVSDYAKISFGTATSGVVRLARTDYVTRRALSGIGVGETKLKVRVNGQLFSCPITVTDHEYENETVQPDPTTGVMPICKRVCKICSKELEVPKGGMLWPLDEYHEISWGFGIEDALGSGNPHRGIDIPAPKGTEIRACADGTVFNATKDPDEEGGWGYYVYIRHENGMSTLYAHCSKLLVKKGDQVKQGDVIGLVGNTGASLGNHLHLEVSTSYLLDYQYLADPRYYLDN